MKTQNTFVKGALVLAVGILNTFGLGIFVPGLNAFVEKIEAKKLKPIGYLPLVTIATLLIINFTGGIKPEDKKAIEETLNEVKIDTTKVDTVKVIVIDSLKK